MTDKNHYPVKIESATEGGYCVFFQDDIGGATQGEDLEDALYMAKDYLKTFFAELFYENKLVPQPEKFDGFTHLVEFTVADWFEVFDWSQERIVIVDESSIDYPLFIKCEIDSVYICKFQDNINTDGVYFEKTFVELFESATQYLIQRFSDFMKNGIRIPRPEVSSPDKKFLIGLELEDFNKIIELSGKTEVLSLNSIDDVYEQLIGNGGEND